MPIKTASAKVAPRKPKRTTKSAKTHKDLEKPFAGLWRASYEQINLIAEHHFHPTRKWRFDFAHVETKVAIEIEGGIWTGGAHTRGKHYESDCEKYNAAAALGWTVFRLTTDMSRDTAQLQQIAETIEKRLRGEQS